MRGTLVIVCFFASGMAALIVEVCWIRRTSLVFGSTTAAMSTVLAVFFGGLALGSLIFGRAAQRTERPLRLYAWIEITLAAAILLSLPALDLAEGWYGAAYRNLSGTSAELATARVALTALVLLIPTILMGGTLPLLCRHFVTPGSKLGERVGALYGVNTLGAAAGCALAGVILIPGVGLRASMRLAAVLDLAVGLLVLFLPPVSTRAPVSTAARGGLRGWATVAPLFFGTGFVALGIEVVGTRYLSLVVMNNVYTYTITLTVVLVGIVLGSWLAAGLVDRGSSRTLLFGSLQISTGLSIVILLRLPPEAWRAMGSEVVVASALLLPAAIFSGASFPVAVRMILDDPARIGIGVGLMSAVNTLGGIGGALIVGLYVLPAFGLDVSARILGGISVAVGLVAVTLAGRSTRVPALAAASIGIAGWTLIPLALPTRVPADFLADRDELVDHAEGRGSHLAVVRAGDELHLEIDRWWQGKNRKNHQAMAAHIPALLHPEARSALIVGIGVGQTPAAFLLHPIERLDCVDIEPALYGFVAKHFDASWMDDNRVRLIREDGRSHVAHTDATYDVISLELGQLFRPGVASFYTLEFYEDAAAHLREGGLLAQMLPLPFLDTETLRRVIATFIRVFPQSVLWYNTSELLLIGVNADRFKLSWQGLAARMSRTGVQEDLAYSYWGGPDHFVNTPEALLAGLLCGPRELAALAEGRPVLSDDRPTLEYATRLAHTRQRQEIQLVELIRPQVAPATTILAHSLASEVGASIAALRDLNLRDIQAHANLRVVEEAGDSIDPSTALTLLGEALRWNPYNFACNRQMADLSIRSGRLDDSERYFRAALELREDDTQSRIGLAYTLIQVNRSLEAIPHLERAVAVSPENTAGHNYLGVALARTGDLARAAAHFRIAVRLAPDDPALRANLERAEAALSDRSP